jgi:hypothetical protein
VLASKVACAAAFCAACWVVALNVTVALVSDASVVAVVEAS